MDAQKNQLLNKILNKVKDRDQFLQNPKAHIEKITGKKLPENLKINVIEDTPDSLNFILPAKKSGELNPEELKSISGGVTAIELLINIFN